MPLFLDMIDEKKNVIFKCKQICLHLNMTEEFESYKGIHPGKVIERLLTKRNINQRPFALSLPEHPQTFNAILKGKRSLNTPLSLKIERALGLEEGSLMTLQIHYDIKQERLRSQGPGPDLPKGLFWDVDIARIDWEKSYKFVIKRIYERGDKQEREIIDRYYGIEKVNEVIAGRPRTETGNLIFMPHPQR
jgi:addiction module HigA family antidote